LVAAEDWARNQGLDRLRVRTRASRKEAHAFYEGRGFNLTKEQRVYDRKIEGPGRQGDPFG
jgi:hypothetical protein